MRQRDWSRSLWFCHQRLCRRTPVLTFSLLLKKFNSSYIFVVNSYWVDIILNLIYSCPATLIELSFHRWQRSLHQPLLWKTFQNHLYFSFMRDAWFLYAMFFFQVSQVFRGINHSPVVSSPSLTLLFLLNMAVTVINIRCWMSLLLV